MADDKSCLQNLAHFVRTHEKGLANAIQRNHQAPKSVQIGSLTPRISLAGSPRSYSHPSTPPSSIAGTIAAALALGSLNLPSQNAKPAKLTLTPHYLFYVLSRFQELTLPVGPMTVRLENLHTDTSPANYVSFLGQSQQLKCRSDRDSTHSSSSVRTILSGMSSLWSQISLGSSRTLANTEKAKAQAEVDLKYLYSAFTKVPCLKLSSDRKAPLIKGYEEFPFDSAVPLRIFKNVSALEITDVDFRQFFGWDTLAEQLRTLTVKRAKVEDPADLLVGIVLDDMHKRRRRSSKAQLPPLHTTSMQASSPSMQQSQDAKSRSAPGSPTAAEVFGSHSSSAQAASFPSECFTGLKGESRPRPRSKSTSRPSSSGQASSYPKQGRRRIKSSGSGSSNSSDQSIPPSLLAGILPASKWRFLRHLSLADNSLTSISMSSLAPLADTLHSLDLSSNHFSEIPDCLATLTALRALNLSDCMIDSLHSLLRSPLPAITALNLRGNRLGSIAGVERLLPLERLDVRDNRLSDPTEIARLTGIPDIHEIWVAGNPFTKTHRRYRITIFNLFRTTPGHRNDIIIDSTGPVYSESKQLVERVAEPVNVPVVKESDGLDEIPALDVDKTAVKAVDTGQLVRPPCKSRPNHISTQSEIVVGSNRRRKGPRTRMAELSGEANSSTTGALPPVGTSSRSLAKSLVGADPGTDTFHVSAQSQPALHPQPRVGTSLSTSSIQSALDLAPSGRAAPVQAQHWSTMGGQAHRRMMESLEKEVGNDWLNIMSEDGWESQRSPVWKRQGRASSHGGAIKSEVSRGMASRTRTLG